MKVSFPTATTAETNLVQAARTKSASAPEIKAAREFEEIFVRKMLSSLEKTGRMGQSGSFSGGSDIYSSMVVDGLANAIASSGGIGLADLIVQSMRARELQGQAAPASGAVSSTAAVQAESASPVGKDDVRVQPTPQASHEATVSDSGGVPGSSESTRRAQPLRRQGASP